MAIVQCKNKHYYDNVKYKECPHCKRMLGTGQNPVIDDVGVTVPFFPEQIDGGGNSAESQQQKTIGAFFAGKNVNPISGWLVCIDGENRGRSFEIHVGKNYVGRSMKMDIHTNDDTISRENHFSIVFEPISCSFYVVAGNGLAYLNGNMITEAEPLKEDDQIEAGKSRYVFVPYCRKGRDWND